MKKLLIALTLVVLTSASALAQDILEFAGCTKDHAAVAIKVQLDEHASKQVVADISKAFKDAAAILGAEDLQAYDPGYLTFASKLSEEDKDAILQIKRPEVIGHCEEKQ